MRDDFETPPGAIQKLLFGGAVVALVLLSSSVRRFWYMTVDD